MKRHRGPSAFGQLLKLYRTLLGLTQEALAERAGVSAHAFSDLERGVNRTPRSGAVQLLASALSTLARREKKAVAEQATRIVAAGGEVWFGDETTLREFPPLRAGWARRGEQQVVVISECPPGAAGSPEWRPECRHWRARRAQP